MKKLMTIMLGLSLALGASMLMAQGDGKAPTATTGWKATPEHEVTRTALPVAARDIVSRYFQALQVERAK